MNETAPKYILELKNELKKDIGGFRQELKEDILTLKTTLTERMDKIDGKVSKMEGQIGKMDGKLSKLDEIIENQEIHFEAIGELKVQVTGIELMLKKKANHEYVKEIEKRTEKLEKVVFA